MEVDAQRIINELMKELSDKTLENIVLKVQVQQLREEVKENGSERPVGKHNGDASDEE